MDSFLLVLNPYTRNLDLAENKINLLQVAVVPIFRFDFPNPPPIGNTIDPFDPKDGIPLSIRRMLNRRFASFWVIVQSSQAEGDKLDGTALVRHDCVKFGHLLCGRNLE